MQHGTGSIRHRETRSSSEFHHDPLYLLRRLSRSFVQENGQDCEEIIAILNSIETNGVHSTEIKEPQDMTLLTVCDGPGEGESDSNADVSRASTPSTVINLIEYGTDDDSPTDKTDIPLDEGICNKCVEEKFNLLLASDLDEYDVELGTQGVCRIHDVPMAKTIRSETESNKDIMFPQSLTKKNDIECNTKSELEPNISPQRPIAETIPSKNKSGTHTGEISIISPPPISPNVTLAENVQDRPKPTDDEALITTLGRESGELCALLATHQPAQTIIEEGAVRIEKGTTGSVTSINLDLVIDSDTITQTPALHLTPKQLEITIKKIVPEMISNEEVRVENYFKSSSVDSIISCNTSNENDTVTVTGNGAVSQDSNTKEVAPLEMLQNAANIVSEWLGLSQSESGRADQTVQTREEEKALVESYNGNHTKGVEEIPFNTGVEELEDTSIVQKYVSVEALNEPTSEIHSKIKGDLTLNELLDMTHLKGHFTKEKILCDEDPVTQGPYLSSSKSENALDDPYFSHSVEIAASETPFDRRASQPENLFEKSVEKTTDSSVSCKKGLTPLQTSTDRHDRTPSMASEDINTCASSQSTEVIEPTKDNKLESNEHHSLMMIQTSPKFCEFPSSFSKPIVNNLASSDVTEEFKHKKEADEDYYQNEILGYKADENEPGDERCLERVISLASNHNSYEIISNTDHNSPTNIMKATLEEINSTEDKNVEIFEDALDDIDEILTEEERSRRMEHSCSRTKSEIITDTKGLQDILDVKGSLKPVPKNETDERRTVSDEKPEHLLTSMEDDMRVVLVGREAPPRPGLTPIEDTTNPDKAFWVRLADVLISLLLQRLVTNLIENGSLHYGGHLIIRYS